MESSSVKKPKPITPSSDHCFFGYYDKSPWDGTDQYLLAHRVDFAHRLPKLGEGADICLIDTEIEDGFEILTETTAWNFQLGSMLQWVGPDYDRFLYNDIEDGRLVSRIHGLDSTLRRTINHPVYTVNPDGKTAVTIDFERLHRTRTGYGYSVTNDSPTGDIQRIPEGDGLSRIDLKTAENELIVSYQRLQSVSPVKSMAGGPHWINHVTFSPSGQRIAFLHRWRMSNGGTYTRLFTVRTDGSELRCLIDSGKVTHYNWRSDDQLLAWTRQQESISDAAKQGWFDLPLVRHLVDILRRVEIPSWIRQNVIGDQYYLYNLPQGESRPVGTGILDRDGHPSFSPDGRWLVTDTYPDNNDNRHLCLYDLETSQRLELGTFHSPPTVNKTPYRCDLHPRWNRSGTEICFDSMHEGTRRVYTLPVDQYVN